MSAEISKWLIRLLGLLYIIVLVAINYAKVGSLYDYSIIIQSSYLFERGLVAHHDFLTPLSHFTTLLARLFESLFGEHYRSLIWANIFLVITFYFWSVAALRNFLSERMSVLVTVAVLSATALQHGIIWYNSIAILLLIATTLSAITILYDDDARQRKNLIQFFLCLVLLGLTKVNFLIIAAAIVLLFALFERHHAKTLIGYSIAGAATGFFLDLAFSHFNLSRWFFEAITTPLTRRENLNTALTTLEGLKTFVTGTFYDYYPAVVSGGIVLAFAIFYVVHYVVYAFGRARTGSTRLVKQLSILFAFFILSCLLIISSIEIQTLPATLFLVGLIICWIVANKEHPNFHWAQSFCVIAASTYLLVVSTINIWNHSRMAYLIFWREAPIEVTSSATVYFKGIQLLPYEYKKLTSLERFFATTDRSQKFFFGPTLEHAYRTFKLAPPENLPAWYHSGITWNPAESEKLGQAFDSAAFDYVILSPEWQTNLPGPYWTTLQRKYAKLNLPAEVVDPASQLTIYKKLSAPS